MSCDHYIGVKHDYDNTDLITLGDLKEHIKGRKMHLEFFKRERVKVYELQDYGDRRKSTDITRFNFCPVCGEKINWSQIKREGYR